jgi:hypothetical protein
MMTLRWLSALAALAALGSSRIDSPDLISVQQPLSSLHPLAKFAVPGSPDWIGVGDSIWISNEPKHNLSRLDPVSNKVVATITTAKTMVVPKIPG